MSVFDKLSHVSVHPTELEFKWADWLYYSKALNFNMELQTQSNWCWAATSKSVSRFYCIFSPWTQCKIASDELGLTCCTNPVPGPCNVPWFLDKALDRTFNFVSRTNGTISWDAVKSELNKGLVIGARQGWSGGGGHFMVIYGVSRVGNTRYLLIDDPIYGKSTLTVNEFSTNYRGSGTWTHTYFTKIHHYRPMWLEDILVNRDLLKFIPETRPLLKPQLPDLDLSKNFNEIDLRFPHYQYIVGLNDIGKEISYAKKSNRLRLIEVNENKVVAAYDISDDEKNPEVLNLIANTEYLNQFIQGLEQLQKHTSDRADLTLKNILVPALNVEALCVSNSKGKENYYYLTRGWEKQNQILNEKEFADYLRQMKKQAVQQDDTMGG